MSGEDIAADIEEALAEVARDTGTSAFLVKLIEPAPAGATPWATTPSGSATEHSVRAMVSDWPQSMIDGTLIRRGDKKIMLSGKSPHPATSWRVEVAGKSHAIISVDSYAPAGVALYHTVQARA